jgi:hypothetical protein
MHSTNHEITATRQYGTPRSIIADDTMDATHRLRRNGPRRLVAHEAIAAAHFSTAGTVVAADGLEVEGVKH